MHVLELERIKISIMPIEFLAGDTDTEKQDEGSSDEGPVEEGEAAHRDD